MATKPFLMSKLLVAGSFNLIISPRKVGKTIVATDIALSIATKQPAWADHRIASSAQGGLVIYVLGEGVGRYPFRIKAWCETRGLSYESVRATPSFVLYQKAVNLLDNDVVDTFITKDIPAICQRTGFAQPTLIVFDTWSRCVAGAEDETAFNTAVANVDHIRAATGATILALHHVPKTGKLTARGSGTLEGAVDAMFTLSAVDNIPHRFVFDLGFSRDLDASTFPKHTFERQTIQFDDVDPDTGDYETSVAIQQIATAADAPKSSRLDQTIHQLVQDHGPMSRQDIVARVGQRKQHVIAAVKRLLDHGHVLQTGTGRMTRLSVPQPRSRAPVPGPGSRRTE
jgi:hypothetical protein